MVFCLVFLDDAAGSLQVLLHVLNLLYGAQGPVGFPGVGILVGQEARFDGRADLGARVAA